MKRLIAALAFCTFTTPAQPNPAVSPTFCAEFEESAAGIMQIRQLQIRTLSEKLKDVDFFWSDDPEMRDLFRDMVIEAYSINRYTTESMQQDAITEFANDQALKCYKSTSVN